MNFKFVFTLTYYTPYVSGLTLYVKRLAEALAKRGNKVMVLTSKHDDFLPQEEIINTVKICRVSPLLKISKGFLMPSYFLASFKAVKNSDAVFINLPQAEGFISAFWGKLLGKKVFCIYHCDLVLPKGLFNFLINKMLVLCNIFSLLLCDKIVVYTQEYAKTSNSLTFFSKKFIQIFPPVYKLPVDKRYLDELREKYKGDFFKIGFAARVAQEKGLEYLIEAVNQGNLRNQGDWRDRGQWKLYIAGPKEEVVGEKKYMKKINKFLELNKNDVIFLGKLDEAQMGAFYEFIDLLAVSSVNRTEAFGLVQAEAMMVGKPVVATDLPGVKFLIEKTGAGKICEVGNSEDLRKKILMVKNDYEKYQEKTKNIERFINLEKTLEQFRQLINC